MAVNISGAPTSKTPGKIGDHLVDSITGKVYECISVNTYGGHDAVTFKRKKTEYVWKCIGDDPNYGQNTGSGLPTGGTPYQQLVTDGSGNTVWEDRLAYETIEDVVFFQEENIAFDGEVERESPCGELVIGHKYTVVWDGVTYPDLVAFDGDGATTIGSPYDSITEDLPFCIATFHSGPEDEVSIGFSTYQDNTTHSVYISGPAKLASKIKQKYLPEIGLNIVLTFDSDKNISSNVTYRQVMDAFNNKKPIRFFIYPPNGIGFESVCARMEKFTQFGSISFYLVTFNTNTAKTNIVVYNLNNANRWSISSNVIAEDAT